MLTGASIRDETVFGLYSALRYCSEKVNQKIDLKLYYHPSKDTMMSCSRDPSGSGIAIKKLTGKELKKGLKNGASCLSLIVTILGKTGSKHSAELIESMQQTAVYLITLSPGLCEGFNNKKSCQAYILKS